MQSVEEKIKKLAEETGEVLEADNEKDILDETLDVLHCCVEILRDYQDGVIDHAIMCHNLKNQKRQYYKPKVTTCKNVGEYHEADQFVCSECGIRLEDWIEVWIDEDFGYPASEIQAEYIFKYCPNCGREVIE